MISPPMRSATASATAVFPTAVGPVMMTTSRIGAWARQAMALRLERQTVKAAARSGSDWRGRASPMHLERATSMRLNGGAKGSGNACSDDASRRGRGRTVLGKCACASSMRRARERGRARRRYGEARPDNASRPALANRTSSPGYAGRRAKRLRPRAARHGNLSCRG